jgi:hypothetical protein
MAESFPTTQPTRPTTPEAFIADRQHFWGLFTRSVTVAVIAVIILLVLMAWFLL